MNIYLDIDGVLLTRKGAPSNYSKEFIHFVLENYPDSTYWLTTHCQGDADKPIQDIGHLFNDETVEIMRKIKPTVWLDSPLKSSAIEFSEPFLWFDDILLYGDKEALLKKGKLENWIKVDLDSNPNMLKDFIDNFPLPVELL